VGKKKSLFIWGFQNLSGFLSVPNLSIVVFTNVLTWVQIGATVYKCMKKKLMPTHFFIHREDREIRAIDQQRSTLKMTTAMSAEILERLHHSSRFASEAEAAV
jgi:hypothetical protein